MSANPLRYLGHCWRIVLGSVLLGACFEPRTTMRSAAEPFDFPRHLSKKQAKESVNFLFAQLEKHHPAPYRSRSKLRVQAEFAGIVKSLPDSVDSFALSTQLELVMASLDDDATSLTTNVRPYFFETSRATNGSAFPALVKIAEGGLVVTKGEQGLRPGDRIQRVSGFDIDSLMTELAKSSAGRQPRYPERIGSWLFFSPRNPGFDLPFVIDVLGADGERRTVRAPGLTPGEFWPRGWDDQKERYVNGKAYRTRFTSDGVAILSSQLPPPDDAPIAAHLAATLDSMRTMKSRVLVLDLRTPMWMSRVLAEELLSLLAPNGRLAKTETPVCVLIDRITRDRAAWFADVVRTRHLARTIGEETAWRRNSYLSGEPFSLPHLGSAVLLPDAMQPPDAGSNDEHTGVSPLIKRVQTARDIAAQRDPAMEAARQCGTLPPP